MLIIPAIDLKGGCCVRLRQGKADRTEVFSNDPVAVAKHWEHLGAKLIHLVDLDGAFKGKLQNFPLIERVVKAVKIPVQLGGGLRDEREIRRVFNAGVRWVVLGTRAFQSPKWIKNLVGKYGRKILIAIDSCDGKIAIRGWRKKTKINADNFIEKMMETGIKKFIFTDVKRDGMMKGPNIKAVKEVLLKYQLKLTASGGISTKKDLMELKKLEKEGLNGVIIGRALYTGAIKLEEAIKIGSG